MYNICNRLTCRLKGFFITLFKQTNKTLRYTKLQANNPPNNKQPFSTSVVHLSKHCVISTKRIYLSSAFQKHLRCWRVMARTKKSGMANAAFCYRCNTGDIHGSTNSSLTLAVSREWHSRLQRSHPNPTLTTELCTIILTIQPINIPFSSSMHEPCSLSLSLFLWP